MRDITVGTGPLAPAEILAVARDGAGVRLSVAAGRTGARPETAQVYAAMLTAGITPVVREYGSLGCSGDLAPLAHCALAAIGEGEVRDASGTLRPAAEALAAAGIEPVKLAEK